MGKDDDNQRDDRYPSSTHLLILARVEVPLFAYGFLVDDAVAGDEVVRECRLAVVHMGQDANIAANGDKCLGVGCRGLDGDPRRRWRLRGAPVRGGRGGCGGEGDEKNRPILGSDISRHDMDAFLTASVIGRDVPDLDWKVVERLNLLVRYVAHRGCDD